MYKEYIVRLWTQPTKFNSGRIEERVVKARSKNEAVYDAEDLYPDWAVIGIEERVDRKGE